MTPIWWGVINIVVLELGMITPPFGINVFVLHGMRSDLPLGQIYRGIVPFLIADILRLGLLVSVPALSLWLPPTAGMAVAASADFSVQALSPQPTLQNGFQRPESLPISRVQKDPNFSVFNVAFGLIGVGLIPPLTSPNRSTVAPII